MLRDVQMREFDYPLPTPDRDGVDVYRPNVPQLAPADQLGSWVTGQVVAADEIPVSVQTWGDTIGAEHDADHPGQAPNDQPDDQDVPDIGFETDDAEPSADAGDGNDLDPPDRLTPSEPAEDEGGDERPYLRLRLPPYRWLSEKDAQRADERVAQYTEDEGWLFTSNVWIARDSPLENDEQSFDSWFDPTLPTGETLKDYIESTVAPNSPRLALELGGVGSRLFAGFSEGFFDETAGVNLTDSRHVDPDAAAQIAADNARNHRVIPGRMDAQQTLDRVDAWLDGRPLNLIIERMFRGIGSLPREPFTLAEQANYWYKKLAPGGIMFAQVPPGLNQVLNEWQELANATPGLEVQTSTREEYFVARVQKLPGAPDELPLLPARTLMERRNQDRRFYL